MIHVIATVRLKPGARDRFLDEFRRIVPEVLAEDGCIDYGPAVDLGSDLTVAEPPRDDVVTVVERWESVEALKAHTAAPHMATYRERVKDLVEGVTLRLLRPA